MPELLGYCKSPTLGDDTRDPEHLVIEDVGMLYLNLPN